MSTPDIHAIAAKTPNARAYLISVKMKCAEMTERLRRENEEQARTDRLAREIFGKDA